MPRPEQSLSFAEIVRRRRMVRRYDPGVGVDRAAVDRLLDLARRAPSAGSSQGWHFLVLDDAPGRELFWSVTGGDGPPDRWLTGMYTAPALIVVFSDRPAYEARYARGDKAAGLRLEDRWPVPYWHIDAGMAALIILLGAVDERLAAGFFGVPPDRVESLLAAFAVPAALVPVGVVSLGHPVRTPEVRTPAAMDTGPQNTGPQMTGRNSPGRRGRAEVVSYGRFGITD